MGRDRVVAEQYTAGVTFDDVVRYGGMIRAHQVDSLATIVVLPGNLYRGKVEARSSRGVEALVITKNMIVPDCRRGCVGDEDALEISILDHEASYGYVANSGIVDAVDKDSIRFPCGVDDSRVMRCAHQGEWFGNHHILSIKTGRHVNYVVFSCSGTGRSNCAITASRSLGIHTQGTGP